VEQNPRCRKTLGTEDDYSCCCGPPVGKDCSCIVELANHENQPCSGDDVMLACLKVTLPQPGGYINLYSHSKIAL
jgi:hypothetical protein